MVNDNHRPLALYPNEAFACAIPAASVRHAPVPGYCSLVAKVLPTAN